MISRDEIYDLLRKALVELFEIPEAEIHPDADLYDDLEIDSIDAIDLIDFIYKQTGYKLQAEDFRHVRRIQDVVEAVFLKQQDGADQ